MSAPLAVIIVSWDVQRTSPNQWNHWAERTRRNRAAKDTARLAWLEAGSPMATGPVVVEITVRRGREIDPDNALGGCKPLIDSLFKKAITPDDSRRWVSFRPVEQEAGRQWKGREEVLFVIRERAAEAAAESPGEPGGKD